MVAELIHPTVHDGVPLPFIDLLFGKIGVQVQVEPLTERNIMAHLEVQSAYARDQVREKGLRGLAERGAIIIDASVDLIPPATVRRLQAEWLNEHREFLRAAIGAVALVAPKPTTRGAIQAALWFAPLPMPMSVHQSLDLALDWAIGMVHGWGGEVDPALLYDGATAIERAKLRYAAA